jgi:phage recombination protein Bet
MEQQRTQQQTKTAQPGIDLSGGAKDFPSVGIPAAPKKKKLIERLADEYGVDPQKLASTLKKTCFKGSVDKNTGVVRDATDEELMALLIVAEQYGLNPWTKEIYAFFDPKRGGIVPVIGIDGWVRIINENPAFNGMRFEYIYSAETGLIEEVICYLWRKDRAEPIIVGELYAECVRDTDPWKKSPRRMLRHKTLIQCARYAFGFAGVHDEDEALTIIEGESSQVDDVGNAIGRPGSGVDALNADVKKQAAAKASKRPPETFEAEKAPPPTDAIADKSETSVATAAASALTYAYVRDQLDKAKTRDDLDAARTLIQEVEDPAQRKELSAFADSKPAF